MKSRVPPLVFVGEIQYNKDEDKTREEISDEGNQI